jgi:long-chain acyl-CoA synthetase
MRRAAPQGTEAGLKRSSEHHEPVADVDDRLEPLATSPAPTPPRLPSHIIPAHGAQTLSGLFRERVLRTPQRVAYRQFDPADKTWKDTTWAEMAQLVARWQGALGREGLHPGDRVAIMMRNCKEWIAFDQAALALGLVVVPLYTNDRADNVAYCLRNSEVRLLLLEGEVQWKALREPLASLTALQRVVTLLPLKDRVDPKTRWAQEWLGHEVPALPPAHPSNPDSLATIVYTSGTTGRPKGVMLSHRNILWNAESSLALIDTDPERDLFLSFLPLSHTLERTGTYYLCVMAGIPVAFARSILQLAEDLRTVRPTVIVSVPRVFERVYARIQDQLERQSPLARLIFSCAVSLGWHHFQHRHGRRRWHPGLWLHPLFHRLVARKVLARLGGRLRLAVSGGAPLSREVARVFIGLGLDLTQGYGLTEHSPVISVNPIEDNDPDSVGVPLPGVELRIGENRELLVKSPGVTLGYWDNPQATQALFDAAGWLRTGDQAHARDGHIYITGRLKEIVVLSNGEKVPPGDMEMAITLDPLFDQAVVVGEGRAFLSAVIVLNREHWLPLAEHLGLDPDDPAVLRHKAVLKAAVDRVRRHTRHFPGYAQVRAVVLTLQPWTVEDGLMTPTLKLRRGQIIEQYRDEVAALYRSLE